MPRRPDSMKVLADYLAYGYWRDTGQSAHRFQTDTISVDLSGLNKAGKALARAALDSWETVADIRFVEKSSGALVSFSDNGSDAETQVKLSGSKIVSADVVVGASWLDTYGSDIGSYSYQTYIHEIGHALGLGHSGNYNAGSGTRQARFASDSWQATVMSYYDQDENQSVKASKAYVMTPMAADILAIQALYGKPHKGPTKGNTVFGQDLKVWGAMTIYDEGGKDTIDFGGDHRAHVVDLAPGTYSNIGGQIGNLGIARGTVIENYVSGAGDDEVTGNKVANILTLGRGDDIAWGDLGNDKLYGQDGNDKLHGQEGNDKLSGGQGDDTFVFDGGRDKILDFESSGDTVVLDRDLWGGAEISVDEALGYARVARSSVLFDFGDGDMLRIAGLSDIGKLADDLAFV